MGFQYTFSGSHRLHRMTKEKQPVAHSIKSQRFMRDNGPFPSNSSVRKTGISLKNLCHGHTAMKFGRNPPFTFLNAATKALLVSEGCAAE